MPDILTAAEIHQQAQSLAGRIKDLVAANQPAPGMQDLLLGAGGPVPGIGGTSAPGPAPGK